MGLGNDMILDITRGFRTKFALPICMIVYLYMFIYTLFIDDVPIPKIHVFCS